MRSFSDRDLLGGAGSRGNLMFFYSSFVRYRRFSKASRQGRIKAFKRFVAFSGSPARSVASI